MEMFAIVIPTFSASAVTLIFLRANMTSMLMMIAMALYRQVVLGLQVDGILQKPLEHSRRSADYGRDKDHHKTHCNAAGNVILAPHSDEQVSDCRADRDDKGYGAVFYDS